VQRGHNREPCFFAEGDCHAYIHWLGEALNKDRCALHAYVLMTNNDLCWSRPSALSPSRSSSSPLGGGSRNCAVDPESSKHQDESPAHDAEQGKLPIGVSLVELTRASPL
jgi:hypothetical protein